MTSVNHWRKTHEQNVNCNPGNPAQVSDMRAPSLGQIITNPRETRWWGVTLLLIVWAIASGSGYVVLGDSAAGPVYYVVRTLGGVVVANAISMVIGLLMVIVLRTRLIAAALLIFGMWCFWMSFALFMGFLVTGVGWSGWVGWLVFSLLSFLQFVTAPRSMLLVPSAGSDVSDDEVVIDIIKRTPARDMPRTRTGES